jgi:hypothetical protein
MGLYIALHLIPGAGLIEVYTGVNSRIAVITFAAVALGVLLSGQAGRFFSLPIAKYWFALLAIEMAASVAGDYPGRSVSYILEYRLPSSAA